MTPAPLAPPHGEYAMDEGIMAVDQPADPAPVA